MRTLPLHSLSSCYVYPFTSLHISSLYNYALTKALIHVKIGRRMERFLSRFSCHLTFPYLQIPCVAGLMILRTLRTSYATSMHGVRGPFRWLLQLTMHTLLLIGLEFIIRRRRRCIATLPAACTGTPMEVEGMSKCLKCMVI